MPVLSCTAPVITPEHEELERSALSIEELQEINNEIYGVRGSNVFSETEEMRQNAEHQLQEAMQSIPNTVKKYYIDAVESVPHLVERETSAIAFMRSEQYNVIAAANRTAAYWKHRHILFRAKALEPMTLSGAMAEERQALKKGIAAILPDDIHGRPVWFLDRTRASRENVSRESMLRIIFYLLHVLSEKSSAQTGVVIVYSLKDFKPVAYFDRIFTKTIVKIIQECMPLRMMAMHACYGSSSPAIELIMPFAKFLLGMYARLRFVAHAGTDEHMLQLMAPYGLEDKNLDSVIGGGFTVNTFLVWLEERSEYECRIYSLE